MPDNLRELDEYRFITVPGLLKERRGKKGGAWLEREEVQKLVEWKLCAFSPLAIDVILIFNP